MGTTTYHRQRCLDRGRGFKPRGKNSLTDGKRCHASRQKHENFGRHHFPTAGPQDIQRTKQAVQPRWEQREGTALERGCNSTFFFWGEAGRLLVCFLSVLCLCPVCGCIPKLFFATGETYQQAEGRRSWTRIRSLMYATGGQAFSRPSPF